nr:IS30 family transposase [Ruoffia tabacinasalis]
MDTVIGNKTKSEPVLLTLVERQTRFEVNLKIDGKDVESVDKAIANLKQQVGDQFKTIFKSITSDNGSEFTELHEALSDALDIYFTHPYASWERGTSENQHKFIRRFIPKGKTMSHLVQKYCLRIQQWMNDYPRKLLSYQTPHEVFVKAFKKARQEE